MAIRATRSVRLRTLGIAALTTAGLLVAMTSASANLAGSPFDAGDGNLVLDDHLWATTGNPATVCEASNTVPCWDKVHSLSGNFEGAINTPSVTDPIPPGAPRTLSPRTFGEAAINLTDSGILPANTCNG